MHGAIDIGAGVARINAFCGAVANLSVRDVFAERRLRQAVIRFGPGEMIAALKTFAAKSCAIGVRFIRSVMYIIFHLCIFIRFVV